MTIRDIVDKSIGQPIRPYVGPLAQPPYPGRAQLLREKGQTATATDGTTLRYTWLHYVPGLTTFCGLRRGVPILTGYMSGCYLFHYRDGGHWRAAHVGTDSTDAGRNTAAKDSWRRKAAKGSVTDIHGYDPAHDISGDLLLKAGGRGVAGILGAWNEFGIAQIGLAVSAHVIGSQTDDYAAVNTLNSVIIAGWEPAPMRSWAVIQHEPKFR